MTENKLQKIKKMSRQKIVKPMAIIQMVALDFYRIEIADHFGISLRTVEKALDDLRAEYHCTTVPALVYKLFKLGLIK